MSRITDTDSISASKPRMARILKRFNFLRSRSIFIQHKRPRKANLEAISNIRRSDVRPCQERHDTAEQTCTKVNAIQVGSADEAREAQKLQKAAEKARRRGLGGVAWGYNPKAGLQGHSSKDNKDPMLEPLENPIPAKDRISQSSSNEHIWGIEQGRPKKRFNKGRGYLHNKTWTGA